MNTILLVELSVDWIASEYSWDLNDRMSSIQMVQTSLLAGL